MDNGYGWRSAESELIVAERTVTASDITKAKHMTAQILTLPIPAEFIEMCRGHGLTPTQVLTAFMADLAGTADTNGSDERMYASNWFDRVLWSERTYEVLPRPAELGGGWKVRFLIDGEEVGGGVFPADPADGLATEDARYEAVEEAERWLSGGAARH